MADPRLYLQDHASSTVSLTETDIVIDLSVDQKPYRIRASKADFGNPSIEATGASVHYGDMVIYRVQNDRLIAEVPFSSSQAVRSAAIGCNMEKWTAHTRLFPPPVKPIRMQPNSPCKNNYVQ